MRRYTTPTIELTVEGHDLTSSVVYATFSQGQKVVTITDLTMALDGEDTVITIELSQLDTARFVAGTCKVQVNWTQYGKRNATEIKTINVTPNLLEEVV